MRRDERSWDEKSWDERKRENCHHATRTKQTHMPYRATFTTSSSSSVSNTPSHAYNQNKHKQSASSCARAEAKRTVTDHDENVGVSHRYFKHVWFLTQKSCHITTQPHSQSTTPCKRVKCYRSPSPRVKPNVAPTRPVNNGQYRTRT